MSSDGVLCRAAILGEFFSSGHIWLDGRGLTSKHAAEANGQEPSISSRYQGRWVNFARELWCKFNDDDVLDGAAVLAFFFVLAVFPAAIFVLSLLPFLAIPHLHEALVDLLREMLPAQAANLFHGTVRYMESGGKKGLAIFGLIFALWSGSSGVCALMERLHAIQDAKERRSFWKVRGMAILLMLFFALLAVVSLSVVIFGGVVQAWLASVIGWSEPLRIFFATLRWVILAATMLLAIAVAYRVGLGGNTRFQYLSAGNVVAAILIALASAGFRFYVSRFGNYSATYGSLAAMIILLLWMYLAGIALLVGCEINTILCRRASQSSGTEKANTEVQGLQGT